MFPWLLFLLSAVLTLMSFFSKYGWWFDLASHFHLQYLVIQLICIIFCVVQKRWKLLSFTVILSLINFSFIVPLYLPSKDNLLNEGRNSDQISVLLINVNSSNREYKNTVDYILDKNPDVLALEEINETWLAELSDILSAYPYQKVIPRRDNFGIGLHSKIPPQSMEIKYYGSVGVPSVLVQYSFGNKSLTLLFTHPVPPGSLDYFNWRNEQLETIITNRNSFEKSMILVGDLNTTSWSYQFRNFVKKMNLVDSRRGFGLQITWPTMLPIMAITIDHILVSPDIKVLNHEIGPHIGSDHYPVFVELIIKY